VASLKVKIDKVIVQESSLRLKLKYQILPVLILFLFLNCRTNRNEILEPLIPALQLVNTYSLSVPEPSGLTLGENNLTLWIVSDTHIDKIYQSDLEGNILRTIDFDGDDLEGIVYDRREKALWLIEEQKREIIKIALNGTEMERHAIAINDSCQNGLEGICITHNYRFWIANEKKPCQLIELNPDFTIHNRFHFSNLSDISELCCDTTEGQFWLLSDEDRLLLLWNRDAGIVKQYDLAVTNPEGLAIDFKSELVYVTSDLEAKLFIFSF
jgi:uncharacterized protein YjiK